MTTFCFQSRPRGYQALDTGQEAFDDSSREGLVSVESDFRRAVKGGVGRKDGPTSTSKSAGAGPTRVVQLSRNLYQTQADLSEGASLEEAFCEARGGNTTSQRFVARGDYGVGDERCRDFSIDACKKKFGKVGEVCLGKFGKSTSTRSDRLKGKRGTERAESTSAAAQRLSRGEANWMFLGDLSRQAALVLPFLPRWDWIDWNCARVVVDWLLNGGSLSGRSRTEAVCGMVRVDFFFLARDNPPAVRSCSVVLLTPGLVSAQRRGGMSILSTVNGRRLGSRYSARRVDPTRRGGEGREVEVKGC